MKLRYIPNILSITRLLLVPVFVVLFLNDHIPAAVAVFLLAGATDVADGYLARKFEWTSTLGRLLDPVADKFLQMSAFVCLWLTHRIPWWMVAVYFVKELATAVGASSSRRTSSAKPRRCSSSRRCSPSRCSMTNSATPARSSSACSSRCILCSPSAYTAARS